MKQQSGFTLMELMITVGIAAILLTIGVPAMGDFVRGNRITAATNDFIGAVTAARSEAMKRRAPVTVCASDNALAATPACDTGADAAWAKGWLIFADTDGDATLDGTEEILARQAALSGEVSIATDAALAEYVSFSAAGLTRDTSNDSVTGSIVVCDDRGISARGDLSTARAVNIARTGRPQTLRKQAEITALGISCS